MESSEDMAQHAPQWETPQRAQSTSCLDLHTSDLDNLRSLLPSYRPAPDYETAIQQKYRNSSSALMPAEPHAIAYSSQPEIHQSAHFRYPDIIEAPFVVKENFDGVGIVHVYKQPPPYPANRIGSNSTPDLAGIAQQPPAGFFVNNLISGSSPDLVSGDSRFLKQQFAEAYPNPIHRSHSYLTQPHSNYENISSVLQQAVIVENPNITKHIQKVYDEHGNIIYCMPANMKQLLQGNRGFVVARNPQLTTSSEPIYENLPRPWQNESGGAEARSRAQSVHSAPAEPPGRENVYAHVGRSPSPEPPYTPPLESLHISDNSSKSKKKRWGLLIGKSKSEEKVKSATLKMEKKREEKGLGKHRWSTGQAKFNPLPPSISKEAMVGDIWRERYRTVSERWSLSSASCWRTSSPTVSYSSSSTKSRRRRRTPASPRRCCQRTPPSTGSRTCCRTRTTGCGSRPPRATSTATLTPPT